MVFTKDEFLLNFSRIIQGVPDFIRGNPIVSTAAIGIGTTGLVLGARSVFKKRKKRKSAVKRRRKVTRKRKKTISHRSPRHRGHKRVSFTTKTGQKVRFLVRGTKRSPKHRRRTSGRKARRFIKGTPEAKRFMAKLRRMKR